MTNPHETVKHLLCVTISLSVARKRKSASWTRRWHTNTLNFSYIISLDKSHCVTAQLAELYYIQCMSNVAMRREMVFGLCLRKNFSGSLVKYCLWSVKIKCTYVILGIKILNIYLYNVIGIERYIVIFISSNTAVKNVTCSSCFCLQK